MTIINQDTLPQVMKDVQLSKAGFANRVLSRDPSSSSTPHFTEFNTTRDWKLNLDDWGQAELLRIIEEMGYVADDRYLLSLIDRKVTPEHTIYDTIYKVVTEHLVVYSPKFYIMAHDVVMDAVAEMGNSESQLCAVFDPIHRHADLLNGHFGTVLGADILTDAWRHPEHKALNRGLTYVVGHQAGSIFTEDSDIIWEGSTAQWTRTTTIRLDLTRVLVITP